MAEYIDRSMVLMYINDIQLTVSDPTKLTILPRDLCEWIFDGITKMSTVEIVRCKDCKWYDPPHIQHRDGTREDYPKEPFVTADIGTIVGGMCIAKNKIYCTAHDRENPDDHEEIVMFRSPDDYCSYGERKE